MWLANEAFISLEIDTVICTHSPLGRNCTEPLSQSKSIFFDLWYYPFLLIGGSLHAMCERWLPPRLSLGSICFRPYTLGPLLLFPLIFPALSASSAFYFSKNDSDSDHDEDHDHGEVRHHRQKSTDVNTASGSKPLSLARASSWVSSNTTRRRLRHTHTCIFCVQPS